MQTIKFAYFSFSFLAMYNLICVILNMAKSVSSSTKSLSKWCYGCYGIDILSQTSLGVKGF